MNKPLPRPIYFEGGFIRFERSQGKIVYIIWKWAGNTKLFSLSGGEYKGESKEEMLKLVA